MNGIRYILFNCRTDQILRVGSCPREQILNQVLLPDEDVIEGIANDVTQKIVGSKVVDKTSEEIEDQKSIPMPIEDQPAGITNKQWQAALKRIEDLEFRITN